MSLYLNFEPHSWYKGWALRKWDGDGFKYHFNAEGYKWEAYIDNGDTYRVEKLQADTLEELKERINERINNLSERDRYNRQRLGEMMS